MQASSKRNEGFLHKSLLDKRKKLKPKFQINNLVRVADLGKTFSKGAMTIGFYTLYKITEINNDKIPSFHIDNLPERYNEASLKKTELTTQENKDVMEKLFITQIKSE